ncbi:MAG: type IV toxin-antitoxin system AbiEi family antitoxin [Alphaproteobacteria bacterium]|nr:type IV toxin-antitoxin system AbiEi family antitoxin [Alphaproteobacteria bacterium]
MQMNGKCLHLAIFIDSLQARGNYFFSKNFIAQQLDITDTALRSSIKRLVKKKRIIRLKKGTYLIVPIEYRNIGAPPPEWFIDHLMKEYRAKYYVGLLTAASLHGAAHQQPQIYQIITDKPLRSVKIGRARIVFYFKKDFKNLAITKMKTSTGYMYISSPELTAFDLVKYLKQSGHINHVTTILAELGEELDSEKLSEVAAQFSQACIQRTGYILEKVGFSNKTHTLLKFIHELSPRYYPLRPDKKWDLKDKNKNWCLYVNEQLEPDL